MQHTAKSHLCRVLGVYRVCFGLAHGKEKVCRVPTVCRVLFLLAHGKGQVCRVPVFAHTANVLAHGNLGVSYSDICVEQKGKNM